MSEARPPASGSEPSAPALSRALAGAGLGLFALAVLRAHQLLAGADPAPGLLAAGCLFLGLAWGARRPATSLEGARRSLTGAGLWLLAWSFLAPVPLGLLSGVPAALASALLLGLPAWWLARALPGLTRPAALLGGGLACLGGSLLLLPWLGPLGTGLLGAALVGLAFGGARAAASSDREAGGAAGSDEAAQSAVTGAWPAAFLLAGGIGLGLSLQLRPFTFPGLAAGWALLGAAAGTVLAARLAARVAARPGKKPGSKSRATNLVRIAAALFTLAWLAPFVPLTVRGLVAAPTRPLVALTWGALATVLAAAVHGLGPGLLAGLSLAPAGTARTAEPASARLPHPSPGHGLGFGAGLVALALLPLIPALPDLSSWALLVSGALVLLLLRAGALPSRLRGGAGVAASVLLAYLISALSPTRLGLELGSGSASGPGSGPAFEAELVLERPGQRLVREVERSEGSVPSDDVERPARVLRLDGHALVRADAHHRPDDLLAGHLAALLAPRRGRALVAFSGSGGALEALATHGFEDLVLHQPSRSLEEACRPFVSEGAVTRTRISPSFSGWHAEERGLDAIVSQADDPSVPLFAPFLTGEAFRTGASLLAPGGVFVQRLRLSRLGPEGLLACLRLMEESFAGVFVATADLGRDGVVLAIGVAGPPPVGGERVRLPHERLLLDPASNPRLSDDVRASLSEALLFKPEDLLGTFAAGPRELKEAGQGIEALSPWTPRGAALRFPAPEAAATQLGRALLYARIQNVDLPLALVAASGRAPWDRRWPLVGVETQLGADWIAEGGDMRCANRLSSWLGELALYRDCARRLDLAREGERIAVLEQGRSVAGAEALNRSARSFLDEHATRTADALVHGHLARVVVREPAIPRQIIHLTWHCPVQQRLYAVEYDLEQAKPGLFQGPLDYLGQSLQCHHPAAPEGGERGGRAPGGA